MPNRRSVLVGLGGLVAGGGLLIGTGAFTTVEAERTVSIETVGDADAFLAMEDERGDGEYVEEADGTIAINLDGNSGGAQGLNRQAITTFRDLVRVTNQGTQTVETLTLAFDDDAISEMAVDDTFAFPANEVDGEDFDEVANGDNILDATNENTPDELGPGDAVVFGLTIDLINGGDDGDLPEDEEYTLTITAEAADD